MESLTLPSRALYLDVAELMRQRIFSGALKPGEWIDELRTSQELGISRTPLREALKVLATEGLITMKLRRGAYVTEVSEQDVREVYHLLGLLESDAARVVAETANASEKQSLLDLHQSLIDAREQRDRFFQINESYHMRILELSQNRWRDQMVADLRKVMKLNRHHSLFKSGRVEQSLREHQEIMDAIASADGQRAALAMQQHFVNGLKAADSLGSPAQTSASAT